MSHRYYSKTERRHTKRNRNHPQGGVGWVVPNQLPGNQMSAHDLAAEIEARQAYQDQEFDAAAIPAVAVTPQQGE